MNFVGHLPRRTRSAGTLATRPVLKLVEHAMEHGRDLCVFVAGENKKSIWLQKTTIAHFRGPKQKQFLFVESQVPIRGTVILPRELKDCSD